MAADDIKRPMTDEEISALRTLEAGLREKHGDGPWNFVIRNCLDTIDQRDAELAKLRTENTRLKNELAGKPKKPRKPVFDKTTTLAAYWNHEENDLEVWFPTSKADAAMMFCYFGGHGCFERVSEIGLANFNKPIPLVKELELRGYDPKTLRFSVKKNGT